MPNPLLNRRDITAQRDQQAQGAQTSGDLLPHPLRTLESGVAGAAAELAKTNEILRRLLLAERVDITSLCVTDHDPAEAVLENFPVPGSRRLIVRRTGTGGSFALTSNTPLEICKARETRLGGQIVVSGAAAVLLYLTSNGIGQQQPTLGWPLIWLAANGGAWDFRLGNLLWGGHVIAVAQGANSTITVAEF